VQLPELLQQIDSLKAEIDALRPLKPELEQRVMQKFRLDWNYNSNAIEGNRLTLGETKAFLLEGLTAEGKPFRDYLDIKGHNELIQFLEGFIRQQETLTEASIRHMHTILLGAPYEVSTISGDGLPARKRIVPGAYKETRNCVQTTTGETHFYCPPVDVPPRMKELLDWHRDHHSRRDLHPVEHAALLHHRFLEIHPFDDGNGRLARILLNLVLMQNGYPILVVRVEHRENYILALRQADVGEPASLVRFMARALLDSERLFLRGARGESIEDASDLDREVLLLKEELKPKLPPVELSVLVQRQQFKEDLLPLFDRIDSKVAQFDELFSRSELTIVSQTILPTSTELFPHKPFTGARKSLKSVLDGFFLHQRTLLYGSISLNWIGFQKDGANDFSVSTSVILNYEARKLRIQIPDISIDRVFLYGHWFSETETQAILSGLGRVLLSSIRSHLNKKTIS
jgi:hypothetical protein